MVRTRTEQVQVRTYVPDPDEDLKYPAVADALVKASAYRENGSQYRCILVVPYRDMPKAKRIADELGIHLRADRNAETGWLLDVIPNADELRSVVYPG